MTPRVATAGSRSWNSAMSPGIEAVYEVLYSTTSQVEKLTAKMVQARYQRGHRRGSSAPSAANVTSRSAGRAEAAEAAVAMRSAGVDRSGVSARSRAEKGSEEREEVEERASRRREGRDPAGGGSGGFMAGSTGEDVAVVEERLAVPWVSRISSFSSWDESRTGILCLSGPFGPGQMNQNRICTRPSSEMVADGAQLG